MHAALTLLSALVYFVLAASALAFVPGVITWRVLRWATGCAVPFNRSYYASLLWTGLASIATLAILIAAGDRAIAMTQPLGSPWLRVALVLDMCLGVLLIWRLVPRGDGYRISIFNACTSVAAVAALVLGALSIVPR